MEGCGALPHAPAGEGALARPREQSVQAQRAKPSTATENRKQSARQARDKTIVVQRNQTSKHPSFQTSNCPCTGGTSATCQRALTRPGEQRTERAGATRQTFHGHGEQSVQAQRAKPSTATERPYGATGEAVAQSGGNRKGQASKPLSFQASTKGARPARRAWRGMAGFARHALGSWAPERSLSRDSQKRKGWG